MSCRRRKFDSPKKNHLPAALLPVGIPLVHGVADIHSSVVVAVTALNSLPRREEGELLEDGLGSLVQEKLEHDLKNNVSGRLQHHPSDSSLTL
jgi:hypothetical protein